MWVEDRCCFEAVSQFKNGVNMKQIFNSVMVVLVALPLSVQAADLFWDGGVVDIGGNGNGVSAGGSGTWNTTIKNWDQNGVPFIAWPSGGNANRAFFAGSGGTVTLGTDMSQAGAYPNSVFVTAGNYVFDLGTNGFSFRGSGLVISSGAKLVLTNGTVSVVSAGITVTGTDALKIYSKVSGSAATVSKGGAGDLYLYNDANDFTGKFYGANASPVYFTSIKNSGVASAVGAGSVLETGYNNQMIYTGPGDTTDRTLSLVGNGYFYLKNNGTGPLVWTGPFANTMNAGTHILQFGGSNTGTNEFRGSLSNSVSGVLSLEKGDAGTWILSGVNTFAGDLDIYGGTLRLGGAGQLGGGTYASPNSTYISAGAIFDFSSSATQTISSAFINNGSIHVNGPGILTLSGNNSYAGVTIISNGTLKAGSTTALSVNSTFSVKAGGTLDLAGYDNTILNLTADTATSVITDSSAPGSGGRLTISTALSAVLAHQFTGSLGLQIFGNAGIAHLSNANSTYSGGTIFGASTVNTRWLGSGTIGTGTGGNVTNGRFGIGTITIGTATNHVANFYFAGATTINNNTIVNTAASTEGAFRAESAGNVIAGSIMANLSDVLFTTWNGVGRTINVTGQVYGPSGLRVTTSNNGGLTVTLSNAGTANSYAGNTVISGNTTGVLALGVADQIPNGAGKGNVVVTAGTLNLNGFNETINGLSGAGIVDGGSGTPTLTVGDNNATSTFAGVITDTAGTLSLTKTGSGYLMLNGVNTYSGTTLVNAGTLGGSGTIGGPVSVAANAELAPGSATGTVGKLTLGGTLALNDADLTYDLNTPGTAGVDYDQITVAGALTMTGVNNIQLNVLSGFIVDGTYNLMTFGASTASTFTFTNGMTTMMMGSATLTLVNSTTSLQLTVAGAPKTLTWKGPSASTIWDTVTANWLNGVAPSVFSAGDAVTFDDSASTFTVTGSGSPASVVFTNKNNAYTVSADIGGSGTTLRKTGTNTVTLSGNNTFTGGSHLQAGFTRIQSDTALGTGTIQLGNKTANTWLVLDRAGMVVSNHLSIASDGEWNMVNFASNNNAIVGDIALDVTSPDQVNFYSGTNNTDRLDLYGDITGTNANGGFRVQWPDTIARYGGVVGLHGDNRGLKGYIDVTSAGTLEVYHDNALGADYPVTVRMGWNNPWLRLGDGVVAGANNVTLYKGPNINQNAWANIGLVAGAASAELAADINHVAAAGLYIAFSPTNTQTLIVSGDLLGSGDWLVNGVGKTVFSGSGSTGTGRFINDRGWVEFGHPNALADMLIESQNPDTIYSASYDGITISNDTVITAGFPRGYYRGTNDFTMAGSIMNTHATSIPEVYVDGSASVTFAGDIGIGTYLSITGVRPPTFYKTGSGDLRFTHTDPEIYQLNVRHASGKVELGASTVLTITNGVPEINTTTGGTITGGTIRTYSGDGTLRIDMATGNQLTIASKLFVSTDGINDDGQLIIYGGSGSVLTLQNSNNTFGESVGIGNTYPLILFGGTISSDEIGTIGAASALGDSTRIFLQGSYSAATLRYTGSGETTDKQICLTDTVHEKKVEASGSGPLQINGDFVNTGTGGNKDIILGGTGTGILNNVFSQASGTIGVIKRDSGTWIISSTVGYTRPTYIEDGRMLVNGGHNNAASSWNVQPGGILGGSGFVNGIIYVNGIIAPGASGIGTLTANGGVTWASTAMPGPDTDWQWDLGPGNTADLLDISGNFAKSGTGSFRFDLGVTAQAGTYTLVEWTGSTTFSADDFTAVNLQGLSATFEIVGNTLVLQLSDCTDSPTITLGTFPSSCGPVTELSLPYTGTSQDPTRYTIDYDASANTAGFVDVAAKQTLGIVRDDFSSSTVVKNDNSLRENDIDFGWRAHILTALCRATSAWDVANGVLGNTATNASTINVTPANCTQAALDPSTFIPANSPVARIDSLSGESGTLIDLTFDYSIAPGDSLNVYLYGIAGTFDLVDAPGGYISNLDGKTYRPDLLGLLRSAGDVDLVYYNLKDGNTTLNALVTPLTGSGTFTTTIDIAALGGALALAGIDNINDLGYLTLGFAKIEDGVIGDGNPTNTLAQNLTYVDNVVLSTRSIPIAVPGAVANGTYNGTITVFNDDNCSGTESFTVTITDGAPNTPGTISGATRVCAPDTVAYSIAQVPGAVGYEWSIPANATTGTINETQTEIVVNWVSGGAGNISVYAIGVCELEPNSGTRTLAVIADGGIPVAPTVLPAENITQSGFDARWNATVDSDSYRLDMATLPDFSAPSIVVTNELWTDETKDTRTFSNLEIGNYYYRIRATNSCGTSPNSGIITVTVSQVIANWDTSAQPGGAGNFGTSPLAPRSFAGTYVTVTGLTRQAGVAIAGTGTAGGWGGEGWNAVDQAAAEAANDALTFTIMPKAGVSVNYAAIDVLSYMREANGPTDGMLQYALNYGAFVDIGSLSYPSSAAGGATAPEVPIDLSVVSALQNVNVPVTFRVVNWGASDAAADWYIFNQNLSTSPDLQLIGSFCLSPTTYAMTGGGVYCLPDGDAPSAGLNGSETNVAYQLYIDTGEGPVVDGSFVIGNGGALDFGMKSATGTYTVVATRLSGSGCSANMSGSAVVTQATTPDVPTGLTATFDAFDGDIDLAWSAAAGATNYTVYRSTIQGGPYTEIDDTGATSYSDTTVIRNTIEYFYVVAASSSGCASAYSTEDSATTDVICQTGVAPTLSAPGNRTVNVGQSVQHVITATDSSVSCGAPNITNFPSTLPAYITFVDTPSGASVTRTYTIAPTGGDNGAAQPIRVLAWDDDANAVTNEYSFMVFVGTAASSFSIPITALTETTPGAEADLTWAADEGVAYDVHSTTTPPGANPVWTKIMSAVPANDVSMTESVVADGGMRFYQVAPAGISRTDRDIWGIVRPSVPGGSITYMSPPVPETTSDLDFSGNLGDVLAAALTDPDDRIYIMSPGTNPSWTILRLVGGEWIIDGGGAYTTPLNEGQGFLVIRDSGSASPTFEGPVGNDGQSSITLSEGYNIIGVSEGRALPALTAFENASPVGSYDEEQADQVIMLNSDGSFRRLWRLGNGTWYDTETQGATSLILQPGQAYYYIRRNSGTNLSF